MSPHYPQHRSHKLSALEYSETVSSSSLHASYPSWTAIGDLPLGEVEDEDDENELSGTDGSREVLLLDACRTLVSCGVLTQRD